MPRGRLNRRSRPEYAARQRDRSMAHCQCGLHGSPVMVHRAARARRRWQEIDCRSVPGGYRDSRRPAGSCNRPSDIFREPAYTDSQHRQGVTACHGAVLIEACGQGSPAQASLSPLPCLRLRRQVSAETPAAHAARPQHTGSFAPPVYDRRPAGSRSSALAAVRNSRMTPVSVPVEEIAVAARSGRCLPVSDVSDARSPGTGLWPPDRTLHS